MAGEPFETHPEHPAPREGHSPVVAILLIGIGVIWLLANLGAIDAPDLGQVIRLWPLILVYIGLKQILEKPSEA